MKNLIAVIGIACALSLGRASAQQAEGIEARRIADLLSTQFSKPGSPVVSGPVVVEGDFAVAGWTQGELGGRALLKREGQRWEVVACAGNAFREAATLESAGMPAESARAIAQRLAEAESRLPAERLERLGRFGPNVARFGNEGHPAATPMPSVLVTARPIIEEVGVDHFAAVTAVVTADQLRDQNAIDLASALRRTPGVQISRYNPVGAFGGDQGGAIFIRGLGLSRPGAEIKTYIDGVPFYMGVWNHPLLDLLPVNGMDSITVYKSPQPQVNGNNFASVDLQTKRPTQDGVRANARLSAGSFDSVFEQADIVGRSGNVDFMLAQGYARSDGHRPNADGELKNVMGNFAVRLGSAWRVGATALGLDNQARDPGDARNPPPAVAPRYDTKGSMVSAFVAHEHESLKGELRAYSSRGHGDWLDQPAPDGDTLTKFNMSGARWREQATPWSGGTIVFGVDYDRISGDVKFNRIAPAPSGTYDAPTFRITSPHVSLAQSFALAGGWTLAPSAGVRSYDHSELDSKTAPHAGLTLARDDVTFFANVSRGINYPGLEAPLLSSLIPPLGESWRQLDPEELDHQEIGVKWQPSSRTQLDASLFVDRVKNRYVFGFPPDVPPPPQFINLGAYRMRGAELSLRQSLWGDWVGFMGATFLDPSIDTLPYTPRRALTAGLNGSAGPLRMSIDAQYQSDVLALNRSRFAGSVNTDRVGSFTVVNARVSWPLPALGRGGEIFAAVENLLDREYAYRPGYPMAGRWGQIGVSAGF